MQLLHDYVIDERREILDNGIRLQAIGNISRLPEYVLRPLASLIAESAANQGMVLSLALSYGGQESLADAMQKLAQEVATGHARPGGD
jgi:undecaprenyl diphosphate synthase